MVLEDAIEALPINLSRCSVESRVLIFAVAAPSRFALVSSPAHSQHTNMTCSGTTKIRVDPILLVAS